MSFSDSWDKACYTVSTETSETKICFKAWEFTSISSIAFPSHLTIHSLILTADETYSNTKSVCIACSNKAFPFPPLCYKGIWAHACKTCYFQRHLPLLFNASEHCLGYQDVQWHICCLDLLF